MEVFCDKFGPSKLTIDMIWNRCLRKLKAYDYRSQCLQVDYSA